MTCYCPQSSKNDQLLHFFIITAMFIERRRMTKYGGMSKWRNWWSSLASCHWNKGCNKNWKEHRLDLKLYIFDQFCAWRTEIRKILLQNTGICYRIFSGIFSPTKGDGINDKLKNLTGVKRYSAIMPKFNFEKNLDHEIVFTTAGTKLPTKSEMQESDAQKLL